MLKKYFAQVPASISLMLHSLIIASAAYGTVFAVRESNSPVKIILNLLVTVLITLAVMEPLLYFFCKRLRKEHDLDNVAERYFAAVPLPLSILLNLVIGWATAFLILAALLGSAAFGPEVFLFFIVAETAVFVAMNHLLFLLCRAVRRMIHKPGRELTHTALRAYASVGAFVLMAAHLIVK